MSPCHMGNQDGTVSRFFHPFWAITYSRGYGRLGYAAYTVAVDEMLADGLPGPIENMWDTLQVGDVLHAED